MNNTILRDRLNNLQDSVLKSISIYYTEEGTINSKIVFSCRDWSVVNDDWIIVNIELKNISSFKLHEQYLSSHQVISNAVSLVKIENKIILELGDLADTLTILDDLKFSNFFLIANSYHLTVCE